MAVDGDQRSSRRREWTRTAAPRVGANPKRTPKLRLPLAAAPGGECAAERSRYPLGPHCRPLLRGTDPREDTRTTRADSCRRDRLLRDPCRARRLSRSSRTTGIHAAWFPDAETYPRARSSARRSSGSPSTSQTLETSPMQKPSRGWRRRRKLRGGMRYFPGTTSSTTSAISGALAIPGCSSRPRRWQRRGSS
jgi:hypothetical protein